MTRTPLLYLVHRIPYPPNKGDKVRSYNLLRELARHYEVHLASFIDDAADLEHLPRLSEWCASVRCERIQPRHARLASLRGLFSGEALSLPYYRNRVLAAWIRQQVADKGIRQAVVFSSTMAQYLEGMPELRWVADFCDVDSAKWSEYASSRRGLAAWIYHREGRRLLAYERATAARAGAVTFVSEAEAALFRSLAPEVAGRVSAVSNGVDTAYFSAEHAGPSPYAADERALVFTGAMDYWPNVDAVCTFAREVWPALRAQHAELRLAVVGMNPAPAVRALAEDARITVTGSVADVRPYIAHAALSVAPLRIARGVQNKVLEAMAMGRCVLASAQAATGIDAQIGHELLVAHSPSEWAQQIAALLGDAKRLQAIGAAARERVLAQYSWSARLAGFHTLLEGLAR